MSMFGPMGNSSGFDVLGKQLAKNLPSWMGGSSAPVAKPNTPASRPNVTPQVSPTAARQAHDLGGARALKAEKNKEIEKKSLGGWGLFGMNSSSAVVEDAHRDVTEYRSPENSQLREENLDEASTLAVERAGTDQYEASPYKERKDALPTQDKAAITLQRFMGNRAKERKLKEDRTRTITQKTESQDATPVVSRPVPDTQVRSIARMDAADEAGRKAHTGGLQQSAEANGGRTWASKLSTAMKGPQAEHEFLSRYNHFHSVAGASEGLDEAKKNQSWHRKKDGTWATHGLDQNPTTHQHSDLAGRSAQAAMVAGSGLDVVGGGLKAAGDGTFHAIKFGQNLPRHVLNMARRASRGADRAEDKANDLAEKTDEANDTVEERASRVSNATGVDTSPVTETTGMAAGYTSDALRTAADAFGTAADTASSFVPGLSAVVGGVDTAKNLANLSSAAGIKARAKAHQLRKNNQEAADIQSTHDKLKRLYSPAGASDLIHTRAQLGKELKSNVAPVESYASSDVKTQGAVVAEGQGTAEPSRQELAENKRHLKRERKNAKTNGQSGPAANPGSSDPNSEKFDPTAGPERVEAAPGLLPAAEHERIKSALPEKDRQLHTDAPPAKPLLATRDLALQGKRVMGTTPPHMARTPEEETAKKDEMQKFHTELQPPGGDATEGMGKKVPEQGDLDEAQRHEARQKNDVWQGKKPVRDAVHTELPESAPKPGTKDEAWTHGYQKSSPGKWTLSADRDARKPVDHDDETGNLALTAHDLAAEAQKYAQDVKGRSSDNNRRSLKKASALQDKGKHEEADALASNSAKHAATAISAYAAKTGLDTISLGLTSTGVNAAARTTEAAMGAVVAHTKEPAEKQRVINTHEKNMSEEAMLEQRGHHDKVLDEFKEEFHKKDSKRKKNRSSIGPKRLNEGRSAGSERSNLPDYLPKPQPKSMKAVLEMPGTPTPKPVIPAIPEPKVETADPITDKIEAQPMGFVAARHAPVDPAKGLDLLVKRSPHKGLGWYRSMKRATGRASRFLRGGVDSLMQRLGASPRMTPSPHDERHVGELEHKF